eukprot:877136-Rhodomonas_salina.1
MEEWISEQSRVGAFGRNFVVSSQRYGLVKQRRCRGFTDCCGTCSRSASSMMPMNSCRLS